MPKPIARSKTRKSVAKRFKVPSTGKVLRTRGGRRHLLQCKSAKRKRKLAKSALVHDSDAAHIKVQSAVLLRERSIRRTASSFRGLRNW